MLPGIVPRRLLLAVSGVLLLALPACDDSDVDRARPEPSSPRGRVRCGDLDELAARMRRGYVPGRSPDVLLVPREPNYIGTAAMPAHTGPWDYLVEVPLVFYGPGIVPPTGRTPGEATVADIAPTVASLIGAERIDSDGRALPVAVEVEGTPRVVIVVVLDGVGRNTLAVHEGSAPSLEMMSRRGVDYADATVGSSPSNTPPVHTTIGTGVFPRRHGIPHVRMRTADGGYVDPFERNVADAVRVPTFADTYDLETGNAAEIGLVATVNWHLGMVGHGSSHPGGDRDAVVLLNDQGLQYGDPNDYEILDVADPATLDAETDALDAADGERDGRWRQEVLSDPSIRYMSPAWVSYQLEMLKGTLREGDFGRDEIADLMFVNFKGADTSGHRFGMTSPQVGEVIESQDAALLAATRFLDRHVGAGEWVLVVTADHGQTPYPEESGGWPIRGGEVKADLDAAFGRGSVVRVTSAGVFLSPDGPSTEAVDRRLGDYRVADNVVDGQSVPDEWRGKENEELFDMTMAGSDVIVRNC
ncbi:MAG: alkaline phosphatase family protein [Actinomycetota bacterium]